MTSNAYESEKLLAEYLSFHYGHADEILTVDSPAEMREALDFAVRTVQHFSDVPRSRGLDLGCAVGRSTFEMSRYCAEVVGIDFSAAFISAATTLAEKPLTYQRLDEGNLSTSLVAAAPTVGGGQVSFEQGDAMDLRHDLGNFDRVHAANLLCRLSDPERLLDRLSDLVAPGGELVLATPCTWLEEFTPRENWPEALTLDWLTAKLEPNFELLDVSEEPFLIRETAHKFQWSTSQLSHWKRKS